MILLRWAGDVDVLFTNIPDERWSPEACNKCNGKYDAKTAHNSLVSGKNVSNPSDVWFMGMYESKLMTWNNIYLWQLFRELGSYVLCETSIAWIHCLKTSPHIIKTRHEFQLRPWLPYISSGDNVIVRRHIYSHEFDKPMLQSGNWWITTSWSLVHALYSMPIQLIPVDNRGLCLVFRNQAIMNPKYEPDCFVDSPCPWHT